MIICHSDAELEVTVFCVTPYKVANYEKFWPGSQTLSSSLCWAAPGLSCHYSTSCPTPLSLFQPDLPCSKQENIELLSDLASKLSSSEIFWERNVSGHRCSFSKKKKKEGKAGCHVCVVTAPWYCNKIFDILTWMHTLECVSAVQAFMQNNGLYVPNRWSKLQSVPAYWLFSFCFIWCLSECHLTMWDAGESS